MAVTGPAPRRRRPLALFRRFLADSAAGGLVLMAAAVLALIVANSPWSAAYFGALDSDIGPLSLLHWINDALMAVFFLLVGLEIKRELLEGQLSSWDSRILPGVAALGGMAVPALVFLAFNGSDPALARGWAIPAATDIAFALGVLALLGRRVPVSLRIFLTALAIIDDLGAVVIIALFYTSTLSLAYAGLTAVACAALFAMNRAGVVRLAPYLLVGAVLWFLVYRSGVHATIAGVALALAIPLRPVRGKRTATRPVNPLHRPLHRLEHALRGWVTFAIIPVFGFANAGVSFAGVTGEVLGASLTLGVALGLLAGKLAGVFGSAMLAIRLGWASMPEEADPVQLFGTAMLCGIGFTMSLFIGLLAFAGAPLLQEEVKIGILAGSLAAGVIGWLILRLASSPRKRRRD